MNYDNLNNEQLVNAVIRDYLASEKFETALKGKAYYKNNNDIKNKQRFIIIDGVKQVVNNVQNNIIIHPIFRELVDQKINYLLANDWNVEDDTLSEIFNDKFRLVVEKATIDAISCGIGWIFATPENEFKYVDALEVVPIWQDVAHTELNKVIRMYKDVEYTILGKEEIHYIELWDDEGVTTFKKQGGKYKQYTDKTPHLKQKITTILGGLEEKQYGWGKVPFIPIKYNQDEVSLLTLVKSLIDKMDETASNTQDLLSDLSSKVAVITNAMGTNIEEFVNNRQLYRVVVLPEGGTYTETGTEPDITSAKAWLEHLRNQIYIAGRGYDPLQAIGANASGDARRNLYTSLDLDANQLEYGILEAFRMCIWFINNSPSNKFTIPENTRIKFSRNMMINQGEQIDNAVKAQGIEGITKRTIVAMSGLVENVDKEISESEKEQEEDFNKNQEIFNNSKNKEEENKYGNV